MIHFLLFILISGARAEVPAGIRQALSELEKINEDQLTCNMQEIGDFDTLYIHHDLRESRGGTRGSIKNYLEAACRLKDPGNVQRNVTPSNSLFERTYPQMMRVSQCMRIPVEALYAIWIKEDNCGIGKNVDEGSGPLQITTDAMDEVNHQLGALGPSFARPSATEHFREGFSCVLRRPFRSSDMITDKGDFANLMIKSALYASSLMKVYYSDEVTNGRCDESAFRNQRVLGSRRRRDACWERVFWRYNSNPEYQSAYSRSVRGHYRNLMSRRRSP